MADRVKVWDVKDDKTLRRALEANDHYVDDGYYNVWFHGGRGNTSNGSFSSLYGTMQTIIAGNGVDTTFTNQMSWQEFWSYGRVSAKSYFFHNAADAANLGIRLQMQVSGYQIPDNGTGVNAVNFMNTVDTTVTLATSNGTFAQGFTWEADTDLGAKKRSGRNIIGWQMTREGTHAADTYGDGTDTGDLHWVGTLFTWKPEHRAE